MLVVIMEEGVDYKVLEFWFDFVVRDFLFSKIIFFGFFFKFFGMILWFFLGLFILSVWEFFL